jgi:hypothetical protein
MMWGDLSRSPFRPQTARVPLTTRRLPPEEWNRLQAFEPFQSHGLPAAERAEDWVVLVVERDGAIVGSCSLFTTVHWDCWWIDPASRRRAGVLGALVKAALGVLRSAEVATVYTGLPEGRPELQTLLEHFGFLPAAGQLYVLDVEAVTARMQEA